MKGKIEKPKLRLLLAALVLIALLIVADARFNILTIQSVEIQIQNLSCADTNGIKDSLNILGQNFFLISTDPIQESLKKKFICIKNINLSKFFPNKIKLAVFGREVVAALYSLDKEATISATLENIATPSAKARDSYLVDSDGVIFSKTLDSLAVTKIYLLKSNLSLGTYDESIILTLKILQKLKIFGLNAGDSLILNNFLVIFPQILQPKIIFRLDDNLDTQIASLQLILNKAKIDAEELEFIDLRFDKPIIRIAPKKNNG